jgi:hypothetical protein
LSSLPAPVRRNVLRLRDITKVHDVTSINQNSHFEPTAHKLR